MPIYRYICPACKQLDKRLLSVDEASRPVPCRTTPGCAGVLSRDFKPPSSTVTEVIDNGIMTKRVERFIDVEKLVHDRARKDYHNR